LDNHKGEYEMNGISRKIVGKVVSSFLLALTASVAYSGAMGPESYTAPGKIYAGVFGGGGAVTSGDISQFGTAFYFEAAGGPLAVNAFGTSESSSMGMVGGHIGFAWPNNMTAHWSVTPAVELEGYYVGGAEIEGHDIGNDTIRLPEHDFLVTYPLKTGVFLVNAVLNANNSIFGKFTPYVGVGIGSAVVSISDATATQLSPAEPGINHYNSDPDDTAVAFAAQPKIGVHFAISPYANVFAEYRFLYLSETDYTFGSTMALGHVATAPWLVKIKSQHYNMGTLGIEFDL
jgi:hypothetical protein